MGDLQAEGAALADAVVAALPGWFVRVVTGIGGPREEAADAGRRAAADVGPRLHELLARDVDDQRVNPLALVREAVPYATAVLRAAGVPPVERDDYARAHFPDDDYGLTPMTFGDVDEPLQELGIRWGATKAYEHLRRHAGRD